MGCEMQLPDMRKQNMEFAFYCTRKWGSNIVNTKGACEPPVGQPYDQSEDLIILAPSLVSSKA